MIEIIYLKTVIMGNTNDIQQRSNLIQQFYEPDWYIFKYEFSQQQVWTNNATKQQFIATILPEETINDKYLQLCYFRNQHSQYLYKIQRIVLQNEASKRFLCYNNSRARVLLRPISRRFQEIKQISIKQGLQVLRRAAKALNCLIPYYGVIYPIDYMIVFTEENQPRFWVNRNLASNEISQGLKLKISYQRQIEQAKKYSIICVRELIKIVENKIPERFPEWFQKGYSQQQTFFELMNFVEQNLLREHESRSQFNNTKKAQSLDRFQSFASFLKTEQQNQMQKTIKGYDQMRPIQRTPLIFEQHSRSRKDVKNPKSSNLVLYKQQTKPIIYRNFNNVAKVPAKANIKIIFSQPSSVKSVEMRPYRTPTKNFQILKPVINPSRIIDKHCIPHQTSKKESKPQIKIQLRNTERNKDSRQKLHPLKTKIQKFPNNITKFQKQDHTQKQEATAWQQIKIPTTPQILLIQQEKQKLQKDIEQKNQESQKKHVEKITAQPNIQFISKSAAPSQQFDIHQQQQNESFSKVQQTSVKSQKLPIKKQIQSDNAEQIRSLNNKQALQSSSTNVDLNNKEEQQELFFLKKKIIQQYISGDLKLEQIEKKFGQKVALFNKNVDKTIRKNYKQYNIFEVKQKNQNLSKQISSIFQQFKNEYR